MDLAASKEEHAEFLRHIATISSILDELDEAITALAERHGNVSQAVGCAKTFASSVVELKQEMLRQYLDYRISLAQPAASHGN
jgi:hypothetical protein